MRPLSPSTACVLSKLQYSGAWGRTMRTRSRPAGSTSDRWRLPASTTTRTFRIAASCASFPMEVGEHERRSARRLRLLRGPDYGHRAARESPRPNRHRLPCRYPCAVQPAMLAALSDADRPALAPLTTRDADDFSIALLDAWATAADVLTFYQERIANESYLRTATELRSVLELARTIGYELRPGVAANAYLAFTLEDAAGAPGYATLALGTKVQSVPGPDEKPQTFETVESLDARAAWNKLVPQQTKLVLPENGDTDILLDGINTNLRPGDGLLLFSGGGWDFRRVEHVDLDHSAVVTHVTWSGKLGWRPLTTIMRLVLHEMGISGFHIYALRQRASLFGYNAPDWRAMSPDVRKHYLGPDDSDTG